VTPLALFILTCAVIALINATMGIYDNHSHKFIASFRIVAFIATCITFSYALLNFAFVKNNDLQVNFLSTLNNKNDVSDFA
jgi:hypothetical protein